MKWLQLRNMASQQNHVVGGCLEWKTIPATKRQKDSMHHNLQSAPHPPDKHFHQSYEK